MKIGKEGTEDDWVLRWTPADSPPPTEDEVLVVVRDENGELLYCVGHHYLESEPNDEGDDGKPFWYFTDGTYWPEESLVKWSPLPPIS